MDDDDTTLIALDPQADNVKFIQGFTLGRAELFLEGHKCANPDHVNPQAQTFLSLHLVDQDDVQYTYLIHPNSEIARAFTEGEVVEMARVSLEIS